LPGSLNYLKQFAFGGKFIKNKSLRQMAIFKAKSFVKGIAQDDERIIDLEISPNSFDVVIMNPPFSRSAGDVNLRYGYEKEEIRREMQKEEKNLIRRLGWQGIGQAGLGASFIVLADKLVKNNGRIGIVIPRSILSAVSWKKIRNYLMEFYEIKYIISNHDPGNKTVEPWSWSENTDLGEVMIILEKTTRPLEERETTYVNLWNKPENELKSFLYSLQVISNDLTAYLNDGDYKDIKDGTKTAKKK